MMFALTSYLNRFSIAQKIACGYAFSVGIAVVGTSVGLVIGAISEQTAVQKYHAAQMEVQLLSDLENKMAHLVLHPEKLLAAAGTQLTIRYVTNEYKTDQALFLQDIARFRGLIRDGLLYEGQGHAELLTNLEAFAQEHGRWSETQWSALERQPELFEQLLVDGLTSAEWRKLEIQFENLSEDLVFLRNQATYLRDTAFVQWQQARRFRLWSIIAGMALATVLAIVLAIYISQAIAKPIANLTDITQRVTTEADFDQKIVVDSQDETSILAESIQQLVHWVQQYTEELQLAKDNLEVRVEERTQSLHKAQSQLIQNEKMSSLGQLVAGVAHEINNPVSFIYGNIAPTREYVQDLLDLVELYEQEYPEPTEAIIDKIEEIELEFIYEDLPNVLNSMQAGSDRIKEIVLSLRTFSRLDEATFKESNLHDGLESTLMILRHRLKAQPRRPEIMVLRNYCAQPLVRCYAGPLNQVFMNLLVNAIDAMERDIKNDRLDEPRITISTKLADEYFTLEIHNNGVPIPEDIQHRLFDPFFTTKEVGKGTGMGLAISYQIVTEKHGGTLSCHSSEMAGTSFIVRLPLAADAPPESSPPRLQVPQSNPPTAIAQKVSEKVS